MTPAELGAQWRPIDADEMGRLGRDPDPNCPTCKGAGLVPRDDGKLEVCGRCKPIFRPHGTTPAPATGPDARDGEGEEG